MSLRIVIALMLIGAAAAVGQIVEPAGGAAATAAPARASVQVAHRFDMRELPYPHGVMYVVTVRRPSGGWRPRWWGRFSIDDSYTGSGLAWTSELGTVSVPSGTYLVTGSAKACAEPTGGCDLLGEPQDRCSRSIGLRSGRRYRIVVFAGSGEPCRVRLSRR